MFPASISETAPKRRRGPKPFFFGKKLGQLLRYLDRPDSTLASAAVKFKCSDSTIEKTLARIRAQSTDGNAPIPSTEPGRDAQPEAETPDIHKSVHESLASTHPRRSRTA